MSICPNTRTLSGMAAQCDCQPQEGVMCPHGPTPDAAPAASDEVLEKVERALRAVLAGSSRSSDGLMGWWNTPTIATMEQCDEALAALRSLRGNKT